MPTLRTSSSAVPPFCCFCVKRFDVKGFSRYYCARDLKRLIRVSLVAAAPLIRMLVRRKCAKASANDDEHSRVSSLAGARSIRMFVRRKCQLAFHRFAICLLPSAVQMSKAHCPAAANKRRSLRDRAARWRSQSSSRTRSSARIEHQLAELVAAGSNPAACTKKNPRKWIFLFAE
jgi:hypothetical protein